MVWVYGCRPEWLQPSIHPTLRWPITIWSISVQRCEDQGKRSENWCFSWPTLVFVKIMYIACRKSRIRFLPVWSEDCQCYDGTECSFIRRGLYSSDYILTGTQGCLDVWVYKMSHVHMCLNVFVCVCAYMMLWRQMGFIFWFNFRSHNAFYSFLLFRFL